MDVREKLVELLWEYDQMRMLRMSIEECADRLIQKGLTVGKCENDTKCSDLAICLDENAKEKAERIVDLMTSFYGVDPGYYGVEAYPLASHLIAHGVTVQEDCKDCAESTKNCIVKLQEQIADLRSAQEWIPVTEMLPEIGEGVLAYSPSRGVVADYYDRGIFEYDDVTHWVPLPKPQK